MRLYIPRTLRITSKAFNSFAKMKRSIEGAAKPCSNMYLHYMASDEKLDADVEDEHDDAVVHTANEPFKGLEPLGYYGDYTVVRVPEGPSFAVRSRRLASWLLDSQLPLKDIIFRWAYFPDADSRPMYAVLVPNMYLNMKYAQTGLPVYDHVDPDTVKSWQELRRHNTPCGTVIRDVTQTQSMVLFETLFDNESAAVAWSLNLDTQKRVSLRPVALHSPLEKSGLYEVSGTAARQNWGPILKATIVELLDIGLLIPEEKATAFVLDHLADKPEAVSAQYLAAYWLLLSMWQKVYVKKGLHRLVVRQIARTLNDTRPASTDWVSVVGDMEQPLPSCLSKSDLGWKFLDMVKLYWIDGELKVKLSGSKAMHDLSALPGYVKLLLQEAEELPAKNTL